MQEFLKSKESSFHLKLRTFLQSTSDCKVTVHFTHTVDIINSSGGSSPNHDRCNSFAIQNKLQYN